MPAPSDWVLGRTPPGLRRTDPVWLASWLRGCGSVRWLDEETLQTRSDRHAWLFLTLGLLTRRDRGCPATRRCRVFLL